MPKIINGIEIGLNREKLANLITYKFEVDGERIADAIIAKEQDILEVKRGMIFREVKK